MALRAWVPRRIVMSMTVADGWPRRLTDAPVGRLPDDETAEAPTANWTSRRKEAVMRPTLPSVALVTAVFLLGCQEQGSGPVRPDTEIGAPNFQSPQVAQADAGPPTLTDLVIETPVINTSSSAAELRVRIRVTDDLAGVQTAAAIHGLDWPSCWPTRRDIGNKPCVISDGRTSILIGRRCCGERSLTRVVQRIGRHSRKRRSQPCAKHGRSGQASELAGCSLRHANRINRVIEG